MRFQPESAGACFQRAEVYCSALELLSEIMLFHTVKSHLEEIPFFKRSCFFSYRSISQCGKLVSNEGVSNVLPLLFVRSMMTVALNLQGFSYKACSTTLPNFTASGLFILVFLDIRHYTAVPCCYVTRTYEIHLYKDIFLKIRLCVLIYRERSHIAKNCNENAFLDLLRCSSYE